MFVFTEISSIWFVCILGWPISNYKTVSFHRLAGARRSQNWRRFHRFHWPGSQDQRTVWTGWTNHSSLQVRDNSTLVLVTMHLNSKFILRSLEPKGYCIFLPGVHYLTINSPDGTDFLLNKLLLHTTQNSFFSFCYFENKFPDVSARYFFSAGVGRTGIFVALSIILERMRYEGVVDMYQTVKMLSMQRHAIIQTQVKKQSKVKY